MDEDPGELVRVETELQEAVRRHDRTTLNRIVPDEYVLTGSPRFGVLGKVEWIAAAERIEWESFDLSDVSIHRYDDTAVVHAHISQRGTLEGEDVSGVFIVVDVWVDRGTGWQIVTRYAARRGPSSVGNQGGGK